MSGPRPEAYLRTKWHLDLSSHLATTDMGRKLGAGFPCNIMWPGPRPTCIPSGVLINANVWPQQTCAENWGAVPPFLGEQELGPILHSVAWAEAYLHAKFHLDPCNRLATVHQRYRQTDGQRSDSIGQTVLQTVAQNVSS